MKITENFNTAKQKYGNSLVKTLTDVGIPPQYLLSACRYYQEKQIPIERIQQLFRQWMTYVVKNNQMDDVNRLSFDEFYQTIQKYKAKFGIPNKVYCDEKTSIGKINNANDIGKFPIKNNWCIKQRGMFQKYINNGFSFYIIDNGDESDYVRYAILMVGKDGRKYYYDLNNEQMTNSSISDFQTHLTQGALSFIQNLNENTQYNNNTNMKKVIRIKEKELSNMIYESVREMISELDWKTYANAEKKASERGDMSYWREKGETNPKTLLNKAVDSRLRAERFGKSAKERFNDDYGFRKGKPYDRDYMEVGMG